MRQARLLVWQPGLPPTPREADMARTTNRAGGHTIPAMPAPAKNEARPAASSDPANGPAHPTSRKPNAPTGGGGHGGSK